MTKQTFVKAAKIVHSAKTAGNVDRAVVLMTGFIALFADAPRFDVPRFVKACGLAGIGDEGPDELNEPRPMYQD